MHISPMELLGGFVALLLILFIVILTLVAYTPIMNLIPGYSGNRVRKEMIDNIVRVDSIERRLGELQAYYSNVAVIMEGKTPITRNVQQIGDSIRTERPETVSPNAMDSIIRRQLEGTGVYSLSGAVAASMKLAAGEGMIAPVKGVVSSHFSPRERRFGIGIATANNQQILAAAEGTVIISSWSPDEGYIIEIQHAGNLVSIYRHSAQSLRGVGARVRAGEVIGSTGEGISGEEGKGDFVFELWLNGIPIDPETYILF